MRPVAQILQAKDPAQPHPCGCGGKCGGCGKQSATKVADAIPRAPVTISPGHPPRGVLSLWTRTPMFQPQRGPMLIQTLAICLAARIFAETQFVTDAGGAFIAQQLGWEFDDMALALDDFSPSGLDHIWALGKLVALTIQEGPCIQFDGDALLFKPLPDALTRARLFAQSPDFPSYYGSADMRRALTLAGLPRATPYNAGLLGGSDAGLVRAYAWAGLELATKFHGSDINGTTASMCIEQYQLGAFARRTGVEVATLLPVQPTAAQMQEAGYAHLVGSAKRSTKWITRAESRLARDFPGAYERFLAGWPAVALLGGAETISPSTHDSPYAADF